MAAKPLPPVTVHFLGTCSGGGPIISRNCSSSAVDFGNDIWLFDAADGTSPRSHQSPSKLTNITRIFITHLHADHVLGLVPILTTILSGIGMNQDALSKLKSQGTEKKASINIYGTRGLRRLVRTSSEITEVTSGGAYAVHESLYEGETDGSVPCRADDLHANEAVGEDIHVDQDGVWRELLQEGQAKNGKGWAVSAGPIEHRVASLGYISQEPTPRLPLDTNTLIPLLQSNASASKELTPPISHPLSLLSHLTSLPPPPPYTLPSGDVISPPEPSGIPPRKSVIFGDCAGGTENSTFRSMCADPSSLIHECTNAAIPESVQRGEKGRKVRMKGMDDGSVQRSEDQTGKQVGKEDAEVSKSESERKQREEEKRVETRRKAQSRGHSTPDEVGEFAKSTRARRVVVNHFSAMFPSPRYASSEALPSLLSPVSPYPCPTPYPPPRLPDQVPEPLPLTGSESHIRLIMQSMTDQIDVVWKGPERKPQEADNSDPSSGASGSSHETADARRSVAARDFMVVRVPSHELSPIEEEEGHKSAEEAGRVMQEWKAHGGVWLEDAGVRRWVGVDAVPNGS